MNATGPATLRAIPRARARWPLLGPPLGLALALSISPTLPGASPQPGDDGFIPLFDGRTLEGWKAPDLSWWSVEDGAITGRITPEHPCRTNQYLVWQGGDLADFELKLQSRLTGDGAINNGFQFRSRVLPDGDVAGYQMDNNLQTEWLVRLYDEFGRHTLALRGQRTVLDPDGTATSSELAGAAGPAWFHLEDWHEYHLTCHGSRLTLRVDGRLTAEVEDHDRRRSDAQGALALQLHSGPPTRVQFRHIRLKVLQPATPPVEKPAEPGRDQVLADALAHWDLGVGGHQPRHPLRYVGSLEDFEFNVREEGPGARTAAWVCLLHGGYFDAGALPVMTDRGATWYLRVRNAAGLWTGTLLSQGDTTTGPLFRLQATEGRLDATLRQAHDTWRAGFRLSQVDPRAWHNLVIRRDGRLLEVFCDGRLLDRQSATSGDTPEGVVPMAALLLGAQSDAGSMIDRFHGEFEEAAVWNRALADAELGRLCRVPATTR